MKISRLHDETICIVKNITKSLVYCQMVHLINVFILK